MAMSEEQKQIIILKMKTGLKIVWAVLKPIAIVVVAVGVVIFGAIFQIISASISGKGRR